MIPVVPLPVAILAVPLVVYAFASMADWLLWPVPVIIPNPTLPKHLAAVEAEMRRLGPPVIRAVHDGDGWRALEGSHRVSATAALGVDVLILAVGPHDPVTDHDIVWCETGEPPPDVVRVHDITWPLGRVVHLPRRRVRVLPG